MLFNLLFFLKWLNFSFMSVCFSPLSIQNHSIFKSYGVSYTSYSIPCGKCDACRQAKQDQWVQRLVSEFHYFHSIGGNVVFLTFTYNNHHLPKVRIPVGKDKFGNTEFRCVPCFSAAHVRSFLNILHVRFSEKFPDDAFYKHYMCAEYGHDTKRPHYHCLFFLSPDVDVSTFCFLCQRLWRKHGWMFPFIKKSAPWLVSRCLVRAAGKCASYASKYSTKDLSFYNLPYVDNYMRDYFPRLPKGSDQRKYMIDCFPKHWISKGLGASFIKNYTDSQKLELLTKGYYNTYEQKYIPVSSYLRNKILFYYDKNTFPRISDVTKRPIYTRFVSSFFRDNFVALFRNKVDNYLNNSVYPIMYDNNSIRQYCTDLYVSYSYISDLVHYCRSESSTFLRDLCHFHFVLKFLPVSSIIREVCLSDVDNLPWTENFCAKIWFLSKDTLFLNDNYFDLDSFNEFFDELDNLSDYSFVKLIRKSLDTMDLSESKYFRYIKCLAYLDNFINDCNTLNSHKVVDATLKRFSDSHLTMLSKCSYPINYC